MVTVAVAVDRREGQSSLQGTILEVPNFEQTFLEDAPERPEQRALNVEPKNRYCVDVVMRSTCGASDESRSSPE